MKLNDNGKQMLLLIALFIVAIWFWDSIFLYPIKLFVVLLHEASHGIMAMLFGGKIGQIQIDPRIGGYISYSIPSSKIAQIVIASSGYLGSMILGGLIFILASRTNKDKYITLIIGIITLILSYFVIKSGELFGIVFTLGFGLLMIFSYKYIDDWFHDYMLKFIGLTSCLYVLFDIKSDLIDRHGIGSDADQIAKLTWIPSIVVGAFWALTSVVLLIFILNISFKRDELAK